MNSDYSRVLRNGKIIESNSPESDNTLISAHAVNNETASESDVSPGISEINQNYERKFTALQNESGELKDLMIAMMQKSNISSPAISEQGPSKQPADRSDRWP